MTSHTPFDQTHSVDTSSISIERREGHFEGQFGDELYFQSWMPAVPKSQTAPTLIISHGIGEHSDCYARLAQSMVHRGWSVFGWDLRGHGRSSGKRGFIKNFSDYTDDLSHFVDFLTRNKRVPGELAVLGHSMGALITLKYALDQGKNLKAAAVVLSSPLLGIAVPIPALKEAASKLLMKFAPGLTLFNEIKYKQLTHDPEILKTYPVDTLRHEKICSALYQGMLSTIQNVSGRGAELKTPCLVQAAGHDLIVSLAATEKFFPTLGSVHKKMIVYKDDFHEIYNELDREMVYSDLHDFLKTEFPI